MTEEKTRKNKILGKAVNDNPAVIRSAGVEGASIRSRKQRYEPSGLSKAGSYAEPGTKVSIRSRKQK